MGPLVSIIIRARNEERWIGRTLKMVLRQRFTDLEIILVDNQSTDHTCTIANKFPVKIVNVDQFTPGFALNEGIRASQGKYLVNLSAHCIPRDDMWLENLVAAIESEPSVAGAYGRQLPFAYSSDLDKRDLLITFGLDRRVQVKDHFFHNANSIVRRDVWEQIPFDEVLTNIEDRAWGKAVVAAGHKIVYEPEAAVYHFHGIHQNRDEGRAQSIVRIMESLDQDATRDAIPEGFRPDTMSVLAVLPVLGQVVTVGRHNLLERAILDVQRAKHVKHVAVFAEAPEAIEIAKKCGALVLIRPPDLASSSATLEQALQSALREAEAGAAFYDTILYVNYLYPFRPDAFFDRLIEAFSASGVDSIVPTLKDYSPFWAPADGGKFVKNDRAFVPRAQKPALHRGIVGLGCVTSSEFVRQGHLLGDNIALEPMEEPLYSLKASDGFARAIIVQALDKGSQEFKIG